MMLQVQCHLSKPFCRPASMRRDSMPAALVTLRTWVNCALPETEANLSAFLLIWALIISSDVYNGLVK